MIENFIESSKYAQNLFKIRNEIIQDIKNESLDENVPIITDEVLNYMIFTARNIKAENILEIGTATGYSGLFLAQIANENGGFLTTMEIDEIRYEKAVENFKKLGLFEKNKMIFGDALEEIPKLDKNVKYDFIFIDASKGQYLKFFEMSYELLNENGIIFIDNLMFRGLVAADKEEISKRYSELSEKSLTLEKEIEKNELRISNLKEQFSNLINRLCDEYSLTLEDCERKMELYKNEHFTKEELKRLKENLRELGSFSYDSIEEFEKVKNELEFQKKQEIDLQNSIEDINKIILKLENTMKKTFLNEFKSINENFSNIFKILFNGGEARLELDSEDILNCGIDIIAKPVGKKMQTLSLMSGGEKSLTAVALLFAIFETKPSPFCILDEVDAALDDSNILRYVEYLKNYLTETQFIMITHRKPTMEMADMIYGVTMEQKGVSKIVSMTFNKEKK